MLPKENRLKKTKDFDRVFSKGKGFKKRLLILKKFKNGLNFSRFGFIVNKKVSKKAVIRNKIKRRIRGSIKSLFPKIEKGWDVALITLPGIEKEEFKEIEKNIEEIFKNAEILK